MSMVNVTLPDGTVNEYAAGVTAGEVVLDALGKKHGCLAARINDVERDLSTPCLLYTSPSPRDQRGSRMPSSA